MDAQERTRTCIRQRGESEPGTRNGEKQIVVTMERQTYDEIWQDASRVRTFLQSRIEQTPELFPPEMRQGFQLAGFHPESRKMPGIRLRQIKLRDGRRFTLRPSFVFGYMTGTVDKLDGPLFLLSIGVPPWAITHVFGRNDMFWHRHLERLGRNSLVGTTVCDPQHLPENLVADEHHLKWVGKKGYVAVTVGGGCILGTALASAADEEQLTSSYGVMQQECKDIKADYSPQTVNTDGWSATQNAFRSLFPTITTILCFLHGFLKIRDRCRKAYELHRRIWDVYRAATEEEFRKRMSEFQAWFQIGTWPTQVAEAVNKLQNRVDEYARSYSHSGCHRTSNQVDRLMNRLTRAMYDSRGLHGHQASSERRLRGWALLQNFRPFAPRSNQHRSHYSPAHRLNLKYYHTHWLHNLQTSASLMGFRHRT